MKPYLYTALFLLAGLKAISQSDVSTAKWSAQPVTVDGKLTEWNQPLAFYDDDTKLFFAIANDSTNLYLCFESKDEISQQKLMRAGMKITLSAKGKTKHEAVIAYPLSARQTGDAGEHAPDSTPFPRSAEAVVRDKSSFQQHFLQTHAVMTVEGLATANGTLPLVNATGLTAALNWDTASNLVYEIAIPEKEFFGADYSNKENLAATFTLDVVLNALSKEAGGGGNGAGHGNHVHEGDIPAEQRGQFNGGGYGAGHKGLRPDMNANDNESLRTRSSFKQKFVLAKA